MRTTMQVCTWLVLMASVLAPSLSLAQDGPPPDGEEFEKNLEDGGLSR